MVGCPPRFDALPAPFGLVRYGVAPDHPDVKSVTNDFEKVMSDHASQVAYFGHVHLGQDVTLEELRKLYGAVVLSYGTGKALICTEICLVWRSIS